MNLEADSWGWAVQGAVRMGANIHSGVACETLAGQCRKGSVGALLKIIVLIIHHYMLHEPTAVAFQAAQQLPLPWHLLAFRVGKKGRVFSFFFKCLMIISSLSIPGIVLFHTVWIKGGTCLGGTPFGWVLKAPVTHHSPPLPQASHLALWEHPWPSLLLMRDHQDPSGSSDCTKPHQTAKCNQHCQPCKEGWAGKENMSPPVPSLLL